MTNAKPIPAGLGKSAWARFWEALRLSLAALSC
jgi:hypothetical protein